MGSSSDNSIYIDPAWAVLFCGNVKEKVVPFLPAFNMNFAAMLMHDLCTDIQAKANAGYGCFLMVVDPEVSFKYLVT